MGHKRPAGLCFSVQRSGRELGLGGPREATQKNRTTRFYKITRVLASQSTIHKRAHIVLFRSGNYLFSYRHILVFFESAYQLTEVWRI